MEAGTMRSLHVGDTKRWFRVLLYIFVLLSLHCWWPKLCEHLCKKEVLIIDKLPSTTVCTFSIGWSSVFVQMCGKALLGGPGAMEFPAAVEEGLFFFLGVCCKHLLGQSQPLICLLFLAGRRHHTDRQRWGCWAPCHVLNNLCQIEKSHNKSNRIEILPVV